MTQGLEVDTDAKAQASLGFADVIAATTNNFPDPRYRPKILVQAGHYPIKRIPLPNPFVDPGQSDGTGTKPEFAERLYHLTGDPKFLETIAFDAFAMAGDDTAREGKFLLGVTNVVDVNSAADTVAMSALARGAKQACDQGRFALLGGETAELGYRVSGWGQFHLNWNADANAFMMTRKLITGKRLTPGQPIVGLLETSSRSNGYTDHRAILEADYLHRHGFKSKEDYISEAIGRYFAVRLNDPLYRVRATSFIPHMDQVMGHSFLEQVLVPWHLERREATEALLEPSTLYSRLIYEAQGGVHNQPKVGLVAAAHISGGGVPGKIKRMLAAKGLGAHVDAIFPDPRPIQIIMEIAKSLPEEGVGLMTERKGCEKWNRGLGFVVVTPDTAQANVFITLAKEHGYQAAIVGHILAEPKIEFRGQTWSY